MATQAITQHLLDWIHNLSGLQEAFHNHDTSMGSFYLALTDATSQLQQQLGTVSSGLRGSLSSRNLEEWSVG